MSQSIKVVVRIRPINNKQINLGCKQIINVDQSINQLTIVKPDQPDNIKTFAYDSVFSSTSLQSNVYIKTAYQLVQNVLQGYNGTIFAYGQTGCGKTHSMVGKIQNQQLQGIIPRSFGHILNTISQKNNRQYLIRCSFIQIYNEQVRDLLGKDVKKSLQIKQSPQKGVFIKDLSSNSAKTHQQLMQYMNIGNKNRSVGQTAMNKDSSRSHLLFMLYLQSADLSIPQQSRKYIASKLNLVDLAGSQRINKTGAQGDRLQQAKNINLSLSALGNVISALVDGKSHHIPYRDSKLTRLLQDSLGGNTKTVMIANCSPADYNFDQTLSTLRYASRAKFIKNKPIINQDPKDALLKEYANQIKKLKDMLNNKHNNNNGNYSIDNEINSGNNIQQYNTKMKQKQQQLANQKNQTKLLQQKLKMLQNQHFNSNNVKIDNKIKQRNKQVRLSAMNMILQCVNINQPNSNSNNTTTNNNNNKFQSYQALKLIPQPQNNANPKQIIKYYKHNIKTLQNQLKDIQHQYYLDKQCIFNDIRQLSKQNKLLQGIINILLSPKQLQKVKNKITTLQQQNNVNMVNNTQYNFIKKGDDNKQKTKYGYDEDKKQYIIPYFWLKQKDIILPKLNNNQQFNQSIQLKNNSSIINTLTKTNNNSNLLNNNSCLSLVSSDQQNQNKQVDKNQKYKKIVNNVSNTMSNQKDKNVKNMSFIFGKGGKQNTNKKQLLGVRDVIQQARQSYEICNNNLNPIINKKNRPAHLEPLKGQSVHLNIQKSLVINQNATLRNDKPRKLQKLQHTPKSQLTSNRSSFIND